MSKIITSAAALALLFAGSGAAFAQDGTVSGAAGGAVTGAIVGGPVGAAVGGIAGATLGTILDPPPAEVGQVVVQRPVESIQIQQPIVVGEPLPRQVVLQPVPGYEAYGYTYVNGQAVIVDPNTYTVVQVVQ